MISLQIVHQSSGERDIAVLDLPDVGERLQQVLVYLRISFDVKKLTD